MLSLPRETYGPNKIGLLMAASTSGGLGRSGRQGLRSAVSQTRLFCEGCSTQFSILGSRRTSPQNMQRKIRLSSLRLFSELEELQDRNADPTVQATGTRGVAGDFPC
jgi:hypothetical protein